MSAKNFDINSTRSRFGTVTVIKDYKKISVQLHNTIVVEKIGKSTVVLNSGGWRTVTTKQAMNHALRQLFPNAPFVRQTKGNWFVDFPNGKIVPFRDDMKFRVK